jgi:hypothetical protein
VQAIRHDEHTNGTDTARSDSPRRASRHYDCGNLRHPTADAKFFLTPQSRPAPEVRAFLRIHRLDRRSRLDNLRPIAAKPIPKAVSRIVADSGTGA